MPGVKLTGVSHTARVLQILDCLTIQCLGGAKAAQSILKEADAANIDKAQMKDIVVDLSQNPIHRAFSNVAGVEKCLTTSSILYSYGRDRIKFPLEKLFLQGHGPATKIPETMPDRAIHEPAGQGISLPTFGMIVIALKTEDQGWFARGMTVRFLIFWDGYQSEVSQCAVIGVKIRK